MSEVYEEREVVKKDNWVTRGFSKSQVKRIVFFAKLKAKIYLWLIN